MFKRPIDIQPQSQKTLNLLLAAKDGFVGRVQDYIRAGGDVNAVLPKAVCDFAGVEIIPAESTALMVAAMYAQAPVVKYLFKEVANVDLFVRNSLGKNAFDCVFAEKTVEDADIVALALDDIACLMLDAAKRTGRERELILMGNRLPTETPALLWATEKGLVQTVLRINQLGVPFNLFNKPLDRKATKMLGSDKCDPLHAAIVNDHVKLAIMFMDGEVKINDDMKSPDSNDLDDDRNAFVPTTTIVKLIKAAPATNLSVEASDGSELDMEDGLDVYADDLALATRYAGMDMIKAIYARLEASDKNSLVPMVLLQNVLDRHIWVETDTGNVKLYDPRSGYIAKSLMELLRQPIQAFDDDKQSLIFHAVQGNGQFIDHLVRKGIAVTKRDNINHTPIMHAAALGGLETMPALIKHGASMNDLDRDALANSKYAFRVIDNDTDSEIICIGSLLAFAAIRNQTEMLQRLLSLSEANYPHSWRRVQLQHKLHAKTTETYTSFMLANRDEYADVLDILSAGNLLQTSALDDGSEIGTEAAASTGGNAPKPRGSSLLFSCLRSTPTASTSASTSMSSSRVQSPVQATATVEPATPSVAFWRRGGSPTFVTGLQARPRPDSPLSPPTASTYTPATTPGIVGSAFSKFRRNTMGAASVRSESPQTPATSTPQTPATSAPQTPAPVVPASSSLALV